MSPTVDYQWQFVNGEYPDYTPVTSRSTDINAKCARYALFNDEVDFELCSNSYRSVCQVPQGECSAASSFRQHAIVLVVCVLLLSMLLNTYNAV